MAAFLIGRLRRGLISLIALVLIVFLLVRLTGNPADLYLPEGTSPEAYAEFTKAHGLNDPLPMQFLQFGRDLLDLNLGDSIRQGRPALDIVLEAFPVTLKIAAVTLLVVVSVAVLIGAKAAAHPNGRFDKISGTLSLLGASAPNFWIALTLIIVFAVKLRWLPTSGTGSVFHWIMPVIVLALRPLGVIVQVVREAMINTLAAPYVRTARAKGASGGAVLFKHALRNASLPIVTVVGNQAVNLINGSIIVESIFGWPGIGKLTIDAVLQRDFAVVQAATIVIALSIFMLNILIDAIYVIIDPRLREV